MPSRRWPSRISRCLLSPAACAIAYVIAYAQTSTPPPLKSPETEKVAVRLVQIDVNVDEQALAGRVLTSKDLALVVGERTIDEFFVDKLCADSGAPEPPAGQSVEAPRGATRGPSTMVLFFDQTHLTMAGRFRAVELAKAIVEGLVGANTRASILSSASKLQTVVPLTTDRARLIGGLDAMLKDPKAFDSYAATEDYRVQALLSEPIEHRASLASWYAREEWSYVRRASDRLGVALDGLAADPPAKILVYFGDTLREQAGLHYLRLAAGAPSSMISASAELIPSAAAEIDGVVNAAIARGVHLFMVEAQGISSSPPGSPESERIKQAQRTLAGLAAQTGGEAFPGASGTQRIVNHIGARISCPYVVSFPPGDLPRDTAMSLGLTSLIPGVSASAQGRIVIPSESALTTARLKAAFIDPASQDRGNLHVGLIPRGGDGRTWQAGVQVRFDADETHRIGVDLGASIIRADKVVEQLSGSISTSGKPRPLILERTVSLAPGPFRVVAVAQEHQQDDIASSSMEDSWPDPTKSDPVIAPIAVLQTRNVAVSKDGKVAAVAAVVFDENAALDPALGAALISVVCRGTKTTATLIVERQLEGDVHGDFEPMTIEPAGDPCVQTVDAIQPNVARSPFVDYRIIVRSGGEVVADQRRQLRFAPAKPAAVDR
jgi:hypothetical protein